MAGVGTRGGRTACGVRLAPAAGARSVRRIPRRRTPGRHVVVVRAESQPDGDVPETASSSSPPSSSDADGVPPSAGTTPESKGTKRITTFGVAAAWLRQVVRFSRRQGEYGTPLPPGAKVPPRSKRGSDRQLNRQAEQIAELVVVNTKLREWEAAQRADEARQQEQSWLECRRRVEWLKTRKRNWEVIYDSVSARDAEATLQEIQATNSRIDGLIQSTAKDLQRQDSS